MKEEDTRQLSLSSGKSQLSKINIGLVICITAGQPSWIAGEFKENGSSCLQKQAEEPVRCNT